MKIKLPEIAIVASLAVTATAMGSPKRATASKDTPAKVAKVMPAPDATPADVTFFTDDQIRELVQSNLKEESKRRPSGAAQAGSEDLLSPQYIAFRDAIIKAQTGEQFFEILSKKDSEYDSIPESANDLKFAVARMATWLPLRGLAWKMTPMIHKIAVSQQVLLGTVRNWAEQIKINFANSHVEAQMLFLTMPVLVTNEKNEAVFAQQFQDESYFMNFLAKDVRASLNKAAERIVKIPKMVNVGLKGKGKETPIVFDAKIRFGEFAFDENGRGSYDDMDRYKIVGEAERFAAAARIHRRIAALSSMVAYNWTGHFKLRREIGKKFGIGLIESQMFGNGDASEFINGATRKERNEIIRRSDFKSLYTLTEHGRNWMRISYYHLHKSAIFLQSTWENIKKDDMRYVSQIDPEMLTGRREQIEMGIANIIKLAGACGKEVIVDGKAKESCDPNVNGQAKITGALTGKELSVNLKAFYDTNPPRDLKRLLSIREAGNEDIEPLRQASPLYKDMRPLPNKPDVIEVKFGNQKANFRNYLYGRGTRWDNSSNGYGVIFPGVGSDGVDDAMSIVNETRGTRMVSNAISMFIR